MQLIMKKCISPSWGLHRLAQPLANTPSSLIKAQCCTQFGLSSPTSEVTGERQFESRAIDVGASENLQSPAMGALLICEYHEAFPTYSLDRFGPLCACHLASSLASSPLARPTFAQIKQLNIKQSIYLITLEIELRERGRERDFGIHF